MRTACAILAATFLAYLNSAALTCVGEADCRACKSCNSCEHCAKRGGKCGICHPEMEATSNTNKLAAANLAAIESPPSLPKEKKRFSMLFLYILMAGGLVVLYGGFQQFYRWRKRN